MADTKTTALSRITSPASGDFVMVVDKSDTTMSSGGTNTKITVGDMHGGATAAELGYVAGVSSAIQTQINAKHATIDASSRLDATLIGANGNISNTEYGYLNGTSSAIQTQLNTIGAASGIFGVPGSWDTTATAADLNAIANVGAGRPLASGELGLLKGLTGGTLQSQLAAKHDTIDSSNRLGATLIGANGNVSNTEYGYLSGVTSDIQTQLDAGGSIPTGSGAISECTGRLTAESAKYVSTTDQTLKSTIYFCGPTGGNFRTWLWTPNKYTEWVSGQLSLSMASLSANYPYDIFIHDNSGTPTLSHSVWSNATTRMTAIEMDNAGIIHKNNARTHRYLGTIYLNATGIFQDTIYSRGIWNLYNQRRRTLLAPMTGTYWTYGTATIRASNANTTLNNMRCDWVQGMSDSEVNLVFRQALGYSGTGWGWCGIGIDSTSSDSAQNNTGFYCSANSRWGSMQSEYRGFPGIGYHYGQCLENSPGGVTLYFYGIDGNNYQGSMIGSVMC